MDTSTVKAETGRIVYLDLIRIFAVFCVVVIHICTCGWKTEAVSSFSWQMLNLYDAVSRWCIPVFVMISGGFFLHPDRPVTFGAMLSKNVPRMAAALLIWGELYYQYEAFLANGRLISADLINGVFAVFTLRARRHLWFLYLMIGLYLLTVPLRRLVRGKTAKQLLWLCLPLIAVSGVIPLVFYFSPLRTDMLYMQAPGFVGLYLLGYCIRRFRTDFPCVRALYGAGLAGLFLTIGASSLLSLYRGGADQLFYQNTAPNVVITGIALLVYGKNRLSSLRFSPKWDARIEKLASLSFAAYLVHDFFIIPFEYGLYGLSVTAFPPLLSVPVLALLVYAASLVTAYFLHRIPLISRYIT